MISLVFISDKLLHGVHFHPLSISVSLHFSGFLGSGGIILIRDTPVLVTTYLVIF